MLHSDHRPCAVHLKSGSGRALILAVAAFLFAWVPSIALGDDTWTGNSGIWSSGANWSTGAAPVDGDNVTLTSGSAGPSTITLDVNSASLGSLSISYGATLEQDFAYAMNATEEDIGSSSAGGLSTYDQSAGTNGSDYLDIGAASGSPGAYYLSGAGSLTTGDEVIGDNANGSFTQSGGANSIPTGSLYLGGIIDEDFTGFVGTYTLSSGTLTVGGGDNAGEEIIGNLLGDSGSFTQSGGSNSAVGAIILGKASESTGSYSLSGTGSLTANFGLQVGAGGAGTFTQTGGANQVFGDLDVGDLSGSNGTYELGGGSLSAGTEYIGYGGIVLGVGGNPGTPGAVGSFIQTGGTNNVATLLDLGTNFGASGSYELDGGTLAAPAENIGNQGTGMFTQTGGSNTISGDLNVGLKQEDSYTLSDTGTLSAANEYIGTAGTGTFTQSGTSENDVSGSLAGC